MFILLIFLCIFLLIFEVGRREYIKTRNYYSLLTSVFGALGVILLIILIVDKFIEIFI
jgi:hypothetical protein